MVKSTTSSGERVIDRLPLTKETVAQRRWVMDQDDVRDAGSMGALIREHGAGAHCPDQYRRNSHQPNTK
jgi:hypothetical protein